MATHARVELFVEGEDHAEFVRHLLRRAKFDVERIRVVPLSDKQRIREALARARGDGVVPVALVHTEGRSVPDAQAQARRELGDPDAELFCAVPSPAAWLFADARALRSCVEDDRTRELVDRLPLPEEIPFPEDLARRIFPNGSAALRVVDAMDICSAAARSPTLHNFLSGLARITGNQISLSGDVHARSMGRDTFSNLLAEIAPAESVIYRTIEGSFTAGEMIREIREGTDLGRQYSSDLLRISRDFLARQAQREASR